MAKKNKIETVINELVVDLSPEAMSVWEGKGKKKKMDSEATLENLTVNLAYYKGMFDAFESVVGEIDGLSDAIAEHKESFDTLFAFAKEQFPEDIDNLSEKYAITPFEEADEDGDAISLFSSLELSDAKAVAKELGIKVTKKDTVETLAEKLSEEAEEEDIMSTLEEMGYLEDEESEEEADEEEEDEETEDDEVEEDEEEDDTPDYSEYGLGDLRKLCKENGIKYTPKEKADDLIAKLDEFYGSEDEEEEAEDDAEEDEEESSYEDMSLSELRAECKERGIKYTPKEKEADLIAKLVESDSEEEDEEEEDVTEDELDELLDEEFEDEVLEKEEKATKGTAKKGAKKKGR